jgi:hypothetical protein
MRAEVLETGTRFEVERGESGPRRDCLGQQTVVSDKRDADATREERPLWRVGLKVPINVYEGDRPVCQCHTAEDAQRIVSAMNRDDEQRA